MNMIKPKSETVIYDMAAPASKRNVFLWLVTGGRKGKLFVRKPAPKVEWSTVPDSRCRCVMHPVIYPGEAATSALQDAFKGSQLKVAQSIKRSFKQILEDKSHIKDPELRHATMLEF